jgi:hypothetical protein
MKKIHKYLKHAVIDHCVAITFGYCCYNGMLFFVLYFLKHNKGISEMAGQIKQIKLSQKIN